MQMTPTEFSEVLRASAGGEEPADVGPDFLDTTFEELGYDSLALLETQGRIERDHGVVLSDEAVTELTTPRAFLDLVNEHLGRALAV
ncbi:acyl carrier protein [Actinokineospora sp. PR83]|uniref:acyl carrier protein n=1 Tax=Actinokineospora sp. PR83 TaxID=2884908 RepID=UPI001F21027F|nr:acyl carrier protein [Actinokineospora sp. PR83]MCG8919182.1 acyl carrier protein [Actinokineospora sp. PR83]